MASGRGRWRSRSVEQQELTVPQPQRLSARQPHRGRGELAVVTLHEVFLVTVAAAVALAGGVLALVRFAGALAVWTVRVAA